ncbi:hypothetical protein EI94DRAFT_1700564 [Lactarius quietus]|nr:hypothetical protein EI94DRAFT_1700564 [Lactarius quietus]
MTSVPLEDQGEFLATRWMSVKQLTEAGIPCRRGRFTKEETQKICDMIQMYQKEHNLDDEQLDDLIHSVEPVKGFWSYIARAMPQRGVKSIFYHVQCVCDSLGKAGKWSVVEDQQLQMAVQSHGKDWTAIADFVQHTATDCSDRFCQHIQYKETKWTGAWLSDEESQLVHAMEVLAWGGKSDMSETLEGKAQNEDQRRGWTKDDSYVLICKHHTSPHNPGLCDKINVYTQQTSMHIRGLSTPLSPSSSSLPQCLEGPLGVQVIVLRPDCLLSLDRMLAKPGLSSPPSVIKAHQISFVFEWEARSNIGAAFAAGRCTGWFVDADAISLRELLVPCEMLAVFTSICTILMTRSHFLLYRITWVQLKV